MNTDLFILAENEGIMIEWWDFTLPLEAVYWTRPGLPPVIGLAYTLANQTQAYQRVVIAEELGHHFTSVGDTLPRTFFHYRDRLIISKSEYLALRWAANYLIPMQRIKRAFKSDITTRWELAEHFNVTEQIIDFRLRLPDVASLIFTHTLEVVK